MASAQDTLDKDPTLQPVIDAADEQILPNDTELGQYRVKDFLGRGSLGQVYLAEHMMMGRQFAIKLFPQALSREMSVEEGFRQYLNNASGLRHDHIVETFHADRVDSRCFAVMEAVCPDGSKEAHTLEQSLLDAGGFEPELVIRLGLQICTALEYAHAKGITHGNLKPANVLLSSERPEDAYVKLADYGITEMMGYEWLHEASGKVSAVSKNVSEAKGKPASAKGRTGPLAAMVDTWDHMSPEQQEGHAPDARSNIYTMGLILYRMLTGLPASELGVSASRITEGLDEAWDEIIRTCLAEERQERFQNIRALKQAFARLSDTSAGPGAAQSAVGSDTAETGSEPLPATQDITEQIQPGVEFGPYTVQETIGVGGMGVVYRATDTKKDEDVALKILVCPDEESKTQEAVKRFRQEAEVIDKLDHTGIVKVDDIGTVEGFNYVTMELFLGPFGQSFSLADYLRMLGSYVEIHALQGILLRLLDATAYAHNHGVLHCDIKPANILLKYVGNTEDGRWRVHIKLTDFGLARIVGEDFVRESVSASLQVVSSSVAPADDALSLAGTYEFMSPEQRRGEPATPQSDLYSVGLVLYRMLTGENQPGLYRPSDLRPGIRREWDEVVGKALEEDPADRFASADEMMQAIEAIPT